MTLDWLDGSKMLTHKNDPLAALTLWGHDPDLRATAPLYDGRQVTAVEHQRMFAQAARRFVEAGDAHFVPEAERILALWEEYAPKFWKVYPNDYRRVIETQKRFKSRGLQEAEAVMAAFEENAHDLARAGGK